MAKDWFAPRSYRHLDRPVTSAFTDNVPNEKFVTAHAFAPLLRFEKMSKRYKPDLHKTVPKKRPIMFASHKDAAIYGYYAKCITDSLEKAYMAKGITNNVLAYRKLGRGNASFAAEVYEHALENAPCTLLAFDVEDFFGSLNHRRLKARLKELLATSELAADWYQVLKSVTKYHFVERTDLKNDTVIGPRFKKRGTSPIASIAEIKQRNVPIKGSSTAGKGIPQGTPISAASSNLYLIDFDQALAAFIASIGGLYRRYSDDILVVCPTDKADEVVETVRALLDVEQLTINDGKTERVLFDPQDKSAKHRAAQYLGFTLKETGPGLRPSTLSRRARKLKGAIRRASLHMEQARTEGKSDLVSTRKLQRQFSPTGPRNFSTYARAAAKEFGSKSVIRRQALRIERRAQKAISNLKMQFPRSDTNATATPTETPKRDEVSPSAPAQ
jgi:RNA-directed DNA polymerase